VSPPPHVARLHTDGDTLGGMEEGTQAGGCSPLEKGGYLPPLDEETVFRGEYLSPLSPSDDIETAQCGQQSVLEESESEEDDDASSFYHSTRDFEI
jgi:hypothetical protein